MSSVNESINYQKVVSRTCSCCISKAKSNKTSAVVRVEQLHMKKFSYSVREGEKGDDIMCFSMSNKLRSHMTTLHHAVLSRLKKKQKLTNNETGTNCFLILKWETNKEETVK